MSSLYSNSTDLSVPSKAYARLDTFAHQYDRGDGTINGHPSYSVDEAAAQIDRYDYAYSDKDHDGKTELTFSFTNTQPANFDTGLGDFIAFNAQQQAQTRLVLQSWADVANLTFTESGKAGEGHLSFASYSVSHGEAAFAYYPTSGESWYWVADEYRYNAEPELGSYGRQTLTHEIGHNLGLAHPGDYSAWNGYPNYLDNAPYAEDSRGYSVMSYWSELNTDQYFGGLYASAPLMDDIAAIQLLYGANETTRSGGTVYGFNSNSHREEMTAVDSHTPLIFSIWDAGGIDTLDFSGYHTAQQINLNEGSFSNVGGYNGNVSIAQGVDIENAIGGSSADLIIGNGLRNDIHGNGGKDVIAGEGGADKLWGGAGADLFVYFAASDSKVGTSDRLMDFVSGEDRIDLSGLPQGVNGALHFVQAFNGDQGAMRLHDTSYGSDLTVDMNGDSHADFEIRIIGHANTGDFLV
jgi:serralysin